MYYRRRKKDDLIPFKDVKAMASKIGVIDEQEVRTGFRFLVFNATFNVISFISWQPVYR